MIQALMLLGTYEAPPAIVAEYVNSTNLNGTAWVHGRTVTRPVPNSNVDYLTEEGSAQSKGRGANAEKPEMLVALTRLRSFERWGKNWDAEGAPAPDRDAIEAAAMLLGFMDSKVRIAPRVMLDADAHPNLIFNEGSVELIVSVSAPESFTYYVTSSKIDDADTLKFDRRGLPPEFVEVLRQAELLSA